VEPEILFGKLAYGKWRDWPRVEQDAVEQYLAALIDRLGDESFDPSEVDQWVCGVAQALDDVTPLLDRALLKNKPAARHNLYGLYEWSRRKIEKRGMLQNAFWEMRGKRPDGTFVNPNVALIVAWFRKPHVAEAVDLAYAAAAAINSTMR
jgi:hypothetical protein